MGWPGMARAMVTLSPAKQVSNKRREFQGDVLLIPGKRHFLRSIGICETISYEARI